jgi:hypothetical protein
MEETAIAQRPPISQLTKKRKPKSRKKTALIKSNSTLWTFLAAIVNLIALLLQHFWK